MSDYIEREAAQSAVWEEDNQTDMILAIGSLPAADVAPVRHGRWIGSEMNFGYCDIIQKEYIAKKYICSECGYETGDQAKKFVCCPICMARMDKEDEHETD